jgi:hypothetical protein
MYGSTLSLTSALDGGRWSTPRTGRFTPKKETRYPLYKTLGGPQDQSGRVRKISLPPGLDPRTIQPVSDRYISVRLSTERKKKAKRSEVKLLGQMISVTMFIRTTQITANTWLDDHIYRVTVRVIHC